MKLIDVHSHWGTRRGYPLQTEKELAQQRATWSSETRYHTEAEMADHFRQNGVRAILDLGYAKYRPMQEMRALHDYAFETEAAHRDVILGHWIHVDPARAGPDGVRELRRCIDKRIGFLGYAISASLTPPASDPLYKPYYDLCIEAGIPVLVADAHMSVLEGSIGMFPRRLMVPASAADEALRLIEEAGLGDWIYRP